MKETKFEGSTVEAIRFPLLLRTSLCSADLYIYTSHSKLQCGRMCTTKILKLEPDSNEKRSVCMTMQCAKYGCSGERLKLADWKPHHAVAVCDCKNNTFSKYRWALTSSQTTLCQVSRYLFAFNNWSEMLNYFRISQSQHSRQKDIFNREGMATTLEGHVCGGWLIYRKKYWRFYTHHQNVTASDEFCLQ